MRTPTNKGQRRQAEGRQSGKEGAKQEGRSDSHCHLYTLNLRLDRQVFEKARFSVALEIRARGWTRRLWNW
jgi:hypothetical protein